ncbi:MAG: choice-of-anchor Q domain-containing protein, partial [Verrucomicrobiota bacterium]
THALLTGSPAIDAGISGGPNTDQRGFPRPIDIPSVPNAADGSDIGAYELDFGAPDVTLTCPADIAANNDPGQCSAVVNYPAPLVSGGTANVVVVCNPPSGSVFPAGTTTVTCTGTDAAGNIGTCSFNVTVNDTEPPVASYAVVKKPVLLSNPPRIVGWFQLLATDNCDSDPLIYIKGSVGTFVAGPFHNGDQVEIAHGPSLTPRQAPSAFGGNIATIHLNGDALLWTVDSSGNASTPIKCK